MRQGIGIHHVQEGIQRVVDAVGAGEVQGIAVQHVQREQDGDLAGEVLRLSCGDWSAPEPQRDAQPSGQQPSVPGHLLRPPQHQQPVAAPEVINPSRLDGDKALPGEAGLDQESAKARGTAIHRLLETLPTVPPASWNDVATRLLQQCLHDDRSFGEAERDGYDPGGGGGVERTRPGGVFAEDALAEVGFSVTVAGQPDGVPLQGVMDRVLVRPDKVLVVDFKTNATVPATPEDCPEGILRQMGAYHHALTILYPDRPAEAAILWTRTATMMPLPSPLLQDAWQRHQPA